MKKLLLVVGILFAGQMGSANAVPVTLDFDALPTSPSTAPIGFGSTIEEDGFRLTTLNGFATFGSFNNPASVFFTGSTAVFANTSGGLTTLTQINGNPFTMTGINLAFRGGFPLQATNGLVSSLTFTGTKAAGTVVQTFFYTHTSNVITAADFIFDNSFTDLLSVTFIQGSEGHQFDNIVVDGSPSAPEPTSSISEPGSLAILGIGLAGLGFARRKRMI